jgi:hypothetical protein
MVMMTAITPSLNASSRPVSVRSGSSGEGWITRRITHGTRPVGPDSPLHRFLFRPARCSRTLAGTYSIDR